MKVKRFLLILLSAILVLSAVSCSTVPAARLSVSVEGKGSVQPGNGTRFPVGELVTLYATPEPEWEFSHWEGDAEGIQDSVQLTMDSNKAVTAYFIKTPPLDYTGSDLSIVTKSLPAWIEGTYGTFTLEATGGTGVKTWRGTPPESWVLSTTGVLSGTAPLLGTSVERMYPPFTATVVDEERHARQASYIIRVVKSAPQIDPRQISVVWDENAPPSDYTLKLGVISGGVPPYKMAIPDSFGMPMGMALWINSDGVSLMLKGPPPAAGFSTEEHKFQVYIVDSNFMSATEDVTLKVLKKKVEGTNIRGKVINSETGELEGGALIKIDIINNAGKDVSISTTSSSEAIDADGCNYTIFLPVEIEDTTPTEDIILNCTKSGFKPIAKSVPHDNGRWLQDFHLQPVSGECIMIDSGLHHLGDNDYGGTANSQFQTFSEGRTYSRSFTVEQGQTGFASAALSITHRGAQYNNPIMINGTTISYLSNSFSDGRLGISSLPFNVSLLREGVNTISISAVGTDAPGDIDDFEFIDLYITLSN